MTTFYSNASITLTTPSDPIDPQYTIPSSFIDSHLQEDIRKDHYTGKIFVKEAVRTYQKNIESMFPVNQYAHLTFTYKRNRHAMQSVLQVHVLKYDGTVTTVDWAVAEIDPANNVNLSHVDTIIQILNTWYRAVKYCHATEQVRLDTYNEVFDEAGDREQRRKSTKWKHVHVITDFAKHLHYERD